MYESYDYYYDEMTDQFIEIPCLDDLDEDEKEEIIEKELNRHWRMCEWKDNMREFYYDTVGACF